MLFRSILGNSFSSNLYVKNKIKALNISYIKFLILKFSCNIKISTLLIILNIINNDNNIYGIIFQLPFFKNFKDYFLFNSISSKKDIDLLKPLNFGNYFLGYSKSILPSTVFSVIFILKKIKINYFGLKCSIFGFSNIVGKIGRAHV